MSRERRSVDDGNDSTTNRVSRRNLLYIGTTGAAIGIAGCLGGDDGADDDGADDDGADDDAADDNPDTDDDEGDSDGEVLRDTLTLPALRGDTLHDLNFNQMHPAAEVRYMQGFLWGSLANWSPSAEEWQPGVASDWSFPETIEEGSEASLTIADGLNWHNGDPVTAEDAVGDISLRLLDDPGTFPYLEEWEAVDEKTFQVTFAEAHNRELVMQDFFNNFNFNLEFGSPPYHQYHEGLEDATTEAEEQEILEEATEMHLDEPVGNGPFSFEEAGSDHVLFSKVDDYPLADFNFNNIRVDEVADTYRSATAEQQIDRAINQNFFYEDEVQYEGSEIREYPANKGFGIAFDTRREDLYFHNRRVRQAIAWAVSRFDIALDLAPQVENREEIAETIYPSTVTGMNDNAVDFYLGDWTENLPDYDGRESNFDRAAEILEEEGFYMEDDWWHTPDDERWSFETINYGEWEWQAVPQSIVGQLRAFGIDVEQRTIESGEYWSTAYDGSEYAMRLSVWGSDSPQSPLPSPLSWQQQVTEISSMTRVLQEQQSVDTFEWDMDLYYEAPMPVGDPDGSVEEINVAEQLREIFVTSDPDQIEELTQELAWAKTHYLDSIPVYAFLRNGLYNTKHWQWHEQESDLDHLFHNQLYSDIPFGSVNGKTE